MHCVLYMHGILTTEESLFPACVVRNHIVSIFMSKRKLKSLGNNGSQC